MKTITAILLMSLIAPFIFAQNNPILKKGDPEFLYLADPAAEVYNGRVYVYCSH